ncbi:LysR substrate-binding domain-containing protein [Castellaniella sp. MT123]|uniref:LysR substrate-binding domain-containing protein n=1 Tax=Castellaniella sp. MT123 TaxID=3140381 RepID=UPI0031F42C61
MNLKQLAYFVRVVELRNMTHAAESLHVAQPALSQQMALLEDDVGVALLVRRPRGVEPTVEGQLLYRQAQTILRQVDSIHSILTRKADPVSGAVSVAMASSTARILALPLIRAVRQRYPAIELEIVDIPSADLPLAIQQGRVDISLPPDEENSSSLSTTPLVVEELLVLAHPSVALPRTRLSITDLADIPLILPRPPNKLRMRIDYAFMNARLRYQLLAQASTSAILLPAVSEGLGVTILPYSAAYKEIHTGAIKAYHLTPSLSRKISLCTSKSAPDRPAVTAVIELIRSLTQGLIDDGTWRHCELA